MKGVLALEIGRNRKHRNGLGSKVGFLSGNTFLITVTELAFMVAPAVIKLSKHPKRYRMSALGDVLEKMRKIDAVHIYRAVFRAIQVDVVNTILRPDNGAGCAWRLRPKLYHLFDGKKVLKGKAATFTDANMVGVWTREDAATAFDDFTYRNTNCRHEIHSSVPLSLA